MGWGCHRHVISLTLLGGGGACNSLSLDGGRRSSLSKVLGLGALAGCSAGDRLPPLGCLSLGPLCRYDALLLFGDSGRLGLGLGLLLSLGYIFALGAVWARASGLGIHSFRLDSNDLAIIVTILLIWAPPLTFLNVTASIARRAHICNCGLLCVVWSCHWHCRHHHLRIRRSSLLSGGGGGRKGCGGGGAGSGLGNSLSFSRFGRAGRGLGPLLGSGGGSGDSLGPRGGGRLDLGLYLCLGLGLSLCRLPLILVTVAGWVLARVLGDRTGGGRELDNQRPVVLTAWGLGAVSLLADDLVPAENGNSSLLSAEGKVYLDGVAPIAKH